LKRALLAFYRLSQLSPLTRLAMAEEATAKKRAAKLQFHYIKGPDYRELACHGAIGGITSQRKIWMSLYSERGSIPRLVEFDVEADAGTGTVELNEREAKPSHIEQRGGIIRHVEVTAYLDPEFAQRLHRWLGERLRELGENVEE
jgi:hypothetical protein